MRSLPMGISQDIMPTPQRILQSGESSFTGYFSINNFGYASWWLLAVTK